MILQKAIRHSTKQLYEKRLIKKWKNYLVIKRKTLFLQSQNGTVVPESVEDSVAQLVEQYTFNVWVLGSSPNGITSWDKSKFNRLVPFFLALIPYLSGK